LLRLGRLSIHPTENVIIQIFGERLVARQEAA
jgi:hypothetical protein